MLKPIAISDTVTTCDCCGRTGLKKTVVLKDDNGAIRYHGTGCAAKAIYGYTDASVNNRVRKEAITAQSHEQQRQADIARKAADAQAVLRLLESGVTINDHNPLVEQQRRIWSRANNPLDPGPSFVPWLQWLQNRAEGKA